MKDETPTRGSSPRCGQRTETDTPRLTDSLPVELLIGVADCLGPRDLASMARTCRLFSIVALDRAVWARRTLADRPWAVLGAPDDDDVTEDDLALLGRPWPWIYRACAIAASTAARKHNQDIVGHYALKPTWGDLVGGSLRFGYACSGTYAGTYGEDGFPHGPGVHVTRFNDRAETLIWRVGVWHKGVLQGPCRIVRRWRDHDGRRRGQLYMGDSAHGVAHGIGTQSSLSDPNESYVGDWSGGVRSGHGTQRDADGCLWDGSWMNDKAHGSMTFTHVSGVVAQGEFHLNKRIGPWRFTCPSGTTVEINYKDNEPDAFARVTSCQRVVYEGGWDVRHHRKQGSGRQLCASDVVQTGAWDRGAPVGVHEFRYPKHACRHTHHPPDAVTTMRGVITRDADGMFSSREYDLVMPNGDLLSIKRRGTADGDNDDGGDACDERSVCRYHVADTHPDPRFAGRTLVWTCRRTVVSSVVGDVMPESFESRDARAWVALVESGWACVSDAVVRAVAEAARPKE